MCPGVYLMYAELCICGFQTEKKLRYAGQTAFQVVWKAPLLS